MGKRIERVFKKIHWSRTQPLTTMPAGALIQMGSQNTCLVGEACTIGGPPPEDNYVSFLGSFPSYFIRARSHIFTIPMLLTGRVLGAFLVGRRVWADYLSASLFVLKSTECSPHATHVCKQEDGSLQWRSLWVSLCHSASSCLVCRGAAGE